MKRFCLLILTVVLGTAAALGFDARLSDDTGLTAKGATFNQGRLSLLSVRTGQYALFKFDLGLLPPGTTSSNVSYATLTVFVDQVLRPGGIGLYAVGEDWDEMAIPKVSVSPLPNSPSFRWPRPRTTALPLLTSARW